MPIDEVKFRNNKDLKKFDKLISKGFNLNSFRNNKSVKKLTECNLLSLRFHDKYRILYLIKLNVVYVFFLGNREDVYSWIDKRRLYNENNYKKWLVWSN